MKTAIVGLGLIGGSMAKAIKRAGGHEVFGYDRDEAVMAKAEEEKTVQRLTGERLKECELLLIGLYPKAAVDFVRDHIDDIPEGITIVDLCGVKKAVMEPMAEVIRGKGFNYIGGHPMAGTESSGYKSSRADLFDGASMILVESECSDRTSIERAEKFFLELGFANITRTGKDEHDRIIAFTSQLAHVVSSAYIKSPTALEHFGFSAGSYKDLTRVAKLNETMWTELFLDNAEYLSEEIEGIIERLKEYDRAITSGDREGLKELLRAGREMKEGIDRV